MDQPYKPINCNFHDILLDRATRRVVVKLAYHSSGELSTKETIIKDVYTKSGEEFLLMGDEEVIRLDQISSVDGIPLPKDNTCHI